MDEFIHLPRFPAVICKKCMYGVLPSEIESHFAAKRPHGLEKEDRQSIAARIARIEGLIPDREALTCCEFPFPPDTSEPIAALGEPRTNGFRCTLQVEGGASCRFVCGSIRNIQKHSFEVHSWKSSSGRGRPKKGAANPHVPWRSGVLYQRFFVQGPESGFFEVARG